MPVKNFLNSETKEKLQRVLKEHEHPDIRERVLIFLLLNDGNTQRHIAELIGCSLSKVAFWVVHGDPENLDSLNDDRMKGNYKKATPEYIDLLLKTIEKKRWVDFIPTGNSSNFYLVLQTFYEDLIKKWIELGNLREDFAEVGCKILLVLDNASFHKKEEVLERIAIEMPNLIIEFLPPYSPDYNLVELVWHSARWAGSPPSKEYIANRLFESVEKLESVLNNLLNESGLIIKWDRKIKNKGELVNVI